MAQNDEHGPATGRTDAPAGACDHHSDYHRAYVAGWCQSAVEAALYSVEHALDVLAAIEEAGGMLPGLPTYHVRSARETLRIARAVAAADCPQAAGEHACRDHKVTS